MIESLFNMDVAGEALSMRDVMLTLLLAFVCGQILAWTYMVTHSGLSYSRSYVNALVIIPFLVAMVMMVLAANLVTAFGLMALFAIVRFRNILRDTLDTCYILAAITVGMACGTQRHGMAVLGMLFMVGMLFYLWYTVFGSRNRYDLVLNVQWTRPLSDLPDLMAMLRRHSRRAEIASQRAHDGGAGADLSYHLLMRDPERMDELFSEVRGLNGVSRVTGLVAQDQSEV